MTASTLRVAIPLLGAAYGLVLLLFVVTPPASPIQTGGLSGIGFNTLDLIIATSLILAGAVTWFGGGARRVALLAGVTGLAWLGPYLILDPGSPTIVRLLAVGMAPMWPVLLLHLVLAATSQARLGRGRVMVLCALYLIAGLLATLRVATYDPFFELDCGPTCISVPAVIDPPTGVRAALRQGVQWVSVVAGAALAAWSVRDLAYRRRVAHDRWILLGGIVSGLATMGLAAIALVRRPSASNTWAPLDAIEAALSWALTAAMLSISMGLILAVISVLGQRLRLRQLADDIEAAPQPGSLETALAAVLGDPTIRVGYWLTEDGRYVAPDGGPFEPGDSDPGRTTTAIERDRQPVALVTHQTGLDGGALREIGPGMLVALDNERLRAASLAHLQDLQESRTRIVEVGDAERRRVERDLHDGAQQGLLAVSFDLRLAKLNAERRGETRLAERLATAEALSLEAVEELRGIARGVHPAILSQAGLVPALESLADGSSVPMELHAGLTDRPPGPTEAAAYQVVVEALADAVRRGADYLKVQVSGDPSQVTIEATDDGSIATEPAIRIADRVGASGGEVSVARRADGSGNVVSAVLPCA